MYIDMTYMYQILHGCKHYFMKIAFYPRIGQSNKSLNQKHILFDYLFSYSVTW